MAIGLRTMAKIFEEIEKKDLESNIKEFIDIFLTKFVFLERF